MASRLVRSVLLLTMWAAVATSGAARAADVEEVETLIRQGVELRVHGKDERALPLFQKAYALSRTPRTAGQLGLAEMAVGYWLDAERHLQAALGAPDHPWVAKNKSALEGALTRVRANIGDLTVTGLPRGATVMIKNKERAGTLPLAKPVRVAKGNAEVEVSAQGYTTATTFVEVTGQGAQKVNVELEAGAGPPQDATSPTLPASPRPALARARDVTVAPPPADEAAPGPTSGVRASADERNSGDRAPGGRGRVVAGVVLSSMAVATLATGIIAHVVREDGARTFNQNHCGVTNGMVAGPMGCGGLYSGLQISRNIAIAGYSATALLGGLGLYLLFTGRSDAPPPSTGSAARDRALACAPTLGSAVGTACAFRF